MFDNISTQVCEKISNFADGNTKWWYPTQREFVNLVKRYKHFTYDLVSNPTFRNLFQR